jgi:NAD(P)-dependent dehydrogenase (short-subunit alcohol dehydrogenase family)
MNAVSLELKDRIAIITGGANGLGRATVELFIRQGAQVVIADLDEKRGSDLAKSAGPAARFRRTDVSRRDEVEALVSFAVAEFGGLHIMFNNAGISDNSYGRLLDETFTPFERVMNVNVLGVMLGTQIAARHMAKHDGGSIINTASIAGVRPGHGFPMYRAAKAAVINFTQSAAVELGEYLIRVNCICPGNIPTDLGTYAAPEPGMAQADADRIKNAIGIVRMARQPLKRQADPDDVAQTALFFGSDRSRQITGQVISVDGGATAGDASSLIQEIMEARTTATSGQH